MKEDFEKKLNFDSDTFKDVKRDMNFVLQRLLGNMLEKESTEGSMTLKIDVGFKTEYIPNYNPEIEGESRKIEKPTFKHKVTSQLQIKDEKSGNMDTEMELVFDEDTGEYVMRPVSDTTQRSIFDSDFRECSGDMTCVNDPEGTDEYDGDNNLLPGGVLPALPGPSDVEGGEDSTDLPEEENNSAESKEPEEIEDISEELMGSENGGEPLPFSGEDEDYNYEEPEGEE